MKTCTIPDCGKPHKARGCCDKHYLQLYRTGAVHRTPHDPNEIIIHERHAEVLLYARDGTVKGRARIDLDDVARCKNHKWHLTVKGYVHSAKDNEPIALHHLIVGRAPAGKEVDHVDGNPLNNRKSNPRFITHRQNGMNSKLHKNNTSGYKGVCWSKAHQRWHARIKVLGKVLHLGSFAVPEEAAEAYKAAARKHFGEFARFE